MELTNRHCLYCPYDETFMMKANGMSRVYKQYPDCTGMQIWTCKTLTYARKMLNWTSRSDFWDGCWEIRKIDYNTITRAYTLYPVEQQEDL